MAKKKKPTTSAAAINKFLAEGSDETKVIEPTHSDETTIDTNALITSLEKELQEIKNGLAVERPIEESTLASNILHLSILEKKVKKLSEDTPNVFNTLLENIKSQYIEAKSKLNRRESKLTRPEIIAEVTVEAKEDKKPDTTPETKIETNFDYDNAQVVSSIIIKDAYEYLNKRLAPGYFESKTFKDNFDVAYKVVADNFEKPISDLQKLLSQSGLNLADENQLKIIHLLKIYITANNSLVANYDLDSDKKEESYKALLNAIEEAKQHYIDNKNMYKETFSYLEVIRKMCITAEIAVSINDKTKYNQEVADIKTHKKAVRNTHVVHAKSKIDKLIEHAVIVLSENDSTKAKDANNEINQILYNLSSGKMEYASIFKGLYDSESHIYEGIYEFYEAIKKDNPDIALQAINLIVSRANKSFKINSQEMQRLLNEEIIRLAGEIKSNQPDDNALILKDIQRMIGVMHACNLSLLPLIEEINKKDMVSKEKKGETEETLLQKVSRSLIGKNEVQYEFLKQLENDQINTFHMGKAYNSWDQIGYSATDLITKIPNAHAILEHSSASSLSTERIVKLASCFTPDLNKAKIIITNNPDISTKVKNYVLNAIDQAIEQGVMEIDSSNILNSLKNLQETVQKQLSGNISFDTIKLELGVQTESDIVAELEKTLALLSTHDSAVSGYKYAKKVTQNKFSSRMRGGGASAWIISGQNKALQVATGDRAEMIDDVADILCLLLLVKAESSGDAIDSLVKLAHSNKSTKIHEKTILDVFSILPNEDSKINFARYFFRQHYNVMNQEVIEGYIKDLSSESDKSCAQAFEFFSLACIEKDVSDVNLSKTFSAHKHNIIVNFDKATSLAVAILKSDKMRQWLFAEGKNRSFEFQAIMSTVLSQFKNASFLPLLSRNENTGYLGENIYSPHIFKNWSKDDFEVAISLASPEQKWLLEWAMASNTKAATELLNSEKELIAFFTQLTIQLKSKSLTSQYVEAMDRRIRVEYLNYLNSWDNAKEAMLGEPIDYKHGKTIARAFIQGISAADRSIRSSEALLIASFDKDNIGEIVSLIKDKKDKKAGWRLIEELSKEDQLKLIDANSEVLNTWPLLSTTSYRHSILELSLNGYPGIDSYKIECNEFVKREFNNVGYAKKFESTSTEQAFKAILSEPEIIKILDSDQHTTTALMSRVTSTRLNEYLKLTNHAGFSSKDLLEVVTKLKEKESSIETDKKHAEETKSTVPMLLKYLPTFLENRAFSLDEIDSIYKLYKDYPNPGEVKSFEEHPIIDALNKNIKPSVTPELKSKIISKITANDDQLFELFLKNKTTIDYEAKAPWLKERVNDIGKAFAAIAAAWAAKSLYDKITTGINPLNWFKQKESGTWKSIALVAIGASAGAAIGTVTVASLGTIIGIAAAGAVGVILVAAIGRFAINKLKKITGSHARQKQKSKEMYETLEEYFNHPDGANRLDQIIENDDQSKNLQKILTYCYDNKNDLSKSTVLTNAEVKNRLGVLINYYSKSGTSRYWRFGLEPQSKLDNDLKELKAGAKSRIDTMGSEATQQNSLARIGYPATYSGTPANEVQIAVSATNGPSKLDSPALQAENENDAAATKDLKNNNRNR